MIPDVRIYASSKFNFLFIKHFNMNIDSNKVQTYLSFIMGEELFAINVSKVINILEIRHITKVPKSPPYIKGVINLRGSVLPVVDLRIKFGMPEKENTVDTSIIVLNIEQNGEVIMLGTQVDAVREVLELKDDEISEAPGIGAKKDSGFIEGLYRKDEQFIMILDIDRIFSFEDVLAMPEHAIS